MSASGQFRGRGITAEHFLDVCRGYVAPLESGELNIERQREIAIHAALCFHRERRLD
jgi:hypothetical protein